MDGFSSAQNNRQVPGANSLRCRLERWKLLPKVAMDHTGFSVLDMKIAALPMNEWTLIAEWAGSRIHHQQSIFFEVEKFNLRLIAPEVGTPRPIVFRFLGTSGS